MATIQAASRQQAAAQSTTTQPTTAQPTAATSAKQTALLFINTQNYYCHEDSIMPHAVSLQQLQGCDLGYWCTRIAECKVKWQRLQQASRACGIEVIYGVTQSRTQDGRERSLQQKLSGLHITPGSWEAQVISLIAPRANEVVLHKVTSSVFNSTPLDCVLRNLGITNLIIAGCMTDKCVDHTVRDAVDHSYDVTLLTDCCAAVTPERQQQACNVLSSYCRQQKLSNLLQELVTSAAKTAAGPLATGRYASTAGGIMYPSTSSTLPILDIGKVTHQPRLAGLLTQALMQEGGLLPRPLLAAANEHKFVPASAHAAVATATGVLHTGLPAEHSSHSSPVDAEQHNMGELPVDQQQQADSPTAESDGSGTDDLRADNTYTADCMPGKLSGKGTSSSNKRQGFQGRNMSPHSRKEPRAMYYEYAKQQWESEREFKLHNGQTWVEVAVKGDPSKLERGVVYCKLCRHYGKTNTFGRGYRGGKRTALREHMQTKDHRELTSALEEGRICMPSDKIRLPPADELRGGIRHQDLHAEVEEVDPTSPKHAQQAAAEEPSTAAAASALMQLGTSAERDPAVAPSSHTTPLTPSAPGGFLPAALTAHPGAAPITGQATSLPVTATAATIGSWGLKLRQTVPCHTPGGVTYVVLATAVAKIAAAAGLSREATAEVTLRLHQYLQTAGDELAPEAAATAITVAFSGTTGPELNADILRTALASLVGPSNTPAALRPSG